MVKALSALVTFALALAAVPASAGVFDVMLSKAPATQARAVSGQVPDVTQSFYAPEAGPVAFPLLATDAIRFFRACPNNDGGSSLPNSARVRVFVRDNVGIGIPGIAAEDICVLFNGGTPAQGFSGLGADSVISNSQWNPSPLCPDLRCITADAPTNAIGSTYITFTGANASNPGVGVRNANRKWGHYDSDMPVYALGYKLSGRLTTGLPNGTYTLHIKNYDWTGGLGAFSNQGETVTQAEFNGIALSLGVNNAISYWKDFDSDGVVSDVELAIITAHLNHDCDTPNNP